jgi:hypothetical protein
MEIQEVPTERINLKYRRRERHCNGAILRYGHCIANCWYNIETKYEYDCMGIKLDRFCPDEGCECSLNTSRLKRAF